MRFLIGLLCLVGCFLFSEEARQAIVTSPVADLLGQSYHQAMKKGFSLEDYYHNIPFSGNGKACWRLHQVLFNERVDVLEERETEVKVRISNFYYLHHQENTIQDSYWIAKKHLLFLDSSHLPGPAAHFFPPPICYKTKHLPSGKEHRVITLKKPYYDPVTQETYSVGTRFLALQGQNLSGSYDRGSFKVHIFDKNKHKMTQTVIPKRYCIRNYFSQPSEQIQNYVQVLRSWTQHKKGFIPYVLGGVSWTTNCLEDQYEIKQSPDSTDPYFHRKEWNREHKAGFDCVGIIGRAAQICNIPFFFKNTLTLKKELRPLKRSEPLIEGDLIYYPGHVMVVSNLEKNLIIEARGYDFSDYGRVQEVPLSKRIKNIHTFKDLVEHFHQKEAISILSTSGKPIMKCKSYKLLKIESVWEK